MKGTIAISFVAISLFAFFAGAKSLPNWVHKLNSQGYDKHAHFLIFAIAYGISVYNFNQFDPVLIAIVLVLLGVCIELGQYFFTERSGDTMDVFANMAGVLFAIFLLHFFKKINFQL